MLIYPVHPSGLTDGKPLQLTAVTAGTAQTFHAATAVANYYDEVYMWASNVGTSPATVTVSFGESGTPGDEDLIVKTFTLPPNSPPIPLITGQRLNNGAVVKAYVGTASVINLTGNINRIAAN